MPENVPAVLRRELADIERKLKGLNQRKQAIMNLLNTYNGSKASAGAGNLLSMPSLENEKPELSTLEMAKSIIRKHGEMKAEQIMESIRHEFGVKPAHTLPQMLYIRARGKKHFYRTAEGKFGVLEAKKKQSRKAA